MTDSIQSGTGKREVLVLLQTVERFNLILLILLTAGSWYLIDWPFAQSVLIGSALSSSSFFWLKRTGTKFAQHVARTSEAGGQLNVKSLSTSFIVRFYTRLAILASVLLFISIQFSMNMIGLATGLSTVMVSVIIVVLMRGQMIF
jgi:hypothetical protein